MKNSIFRNIIPLFAAALLTIPANTFAISDEEVATAAEIALLEFEPTASIEPEIQVVDGVVTLDGMAENLPEKQLASEALATVRGVKAVVNRLRLKEKDRDDNMIRFHLDRLFSLNRATKPGAINYEVNDGVVTLTGHVSTFGISYLADTMVSSVAGVRSVTNLLRVEPLTPVEDGEIRQHLALKLQRDPWINSDLVSFKVNQGTVTLLGSVDTLSEKERLTDAAQLYGVTSIDSSKLYVSPELQPKMERPHRPLFRSDEELKMSLQAAFQQDPRLAGSNVEIEVTDQMITLVGSVDNIAAKSAAEANAAALPGAVAAFNFLTVEADDPITDEALATALNAIYETDALLAITEVNAEVEDGIVTLDGVVENKYQRRRAVSIASRASGVQRVVSKLRVDWPVPEVYSDENADSAN